VIEMKRSRLLAAMRVELAHPTELSWMVMDLVLLATEHSNGCGSCEMISMAQAFVRMGQVLAQVVGSSLVSSKKSTNAMFT
jgi:hypothetical protein